MVERNNKGIDTICAATLAVVPILQHYIGIIDNAATSVLALWVPYLFISVVVRLKEAKPSDFGLLSVFSLFFIYKMIDHGTTFFEIAQVGSVIGYFVAISLWCIDLKMVIKAATCIAIAAACCLVVQTFCYYFLGFHLQMVPTQLLLEESQQWVLGVKTGLAGINGKIGTLYRPAAFFLEPSHYFLYSFPLLFINLLGSGNHKKRIAAVLISLGIVLSTSGMGLAVVAGVWILFFALQSKNGELHLENVCSRRNLIHVVVCVICIVLLAFCVPPIRESIFRIFVGSNGASTAIAGRTEGATKVVESVNFVQRIFGVSDSTAHIKSNMPGFMATLYKYGVVGVILSYEFYIKGLFMLDLPYFWFSAILIVVSFFSAHTHGTFFLLYYVMLLMQGHHESKDAWIKEIWSCIGLFFKKKGDS